MTETEFNEFIKLLNSKQNESVYQDYLEKHSELIPCNLCTLNHGVHWNFVFSKLAISQNYITDFAYLTKSTQEWYVVLIELEKVSKKFFKINGKNLEFSADFTSALNQVNDWKLELTHSNELLKKDLKPLLGFNLTFRANPITFKYMLIYGRSEEIDTELKKEKFKQIQQQNDIIIVTYDSLVSNIKHNNMGFFSATLCPKNIIKKVKNGFEMKYINPDSNDWMQYLSKEQMHLSEPQKKFLRDNHILVDDWENNKKLCNFGRCLCDELFSKNRKEV